MRDYMKQRKPTADEMYLEALRIRAEYDGPLQTKKFYEHGGVGYVTYPVVAEIDAAVSHYKRLAGVE